MLGSVPSVCLPFWKLRWYGETDGVFLRMDLTPLWELTMMQIMNVINDKPEWDRKVYQSRTPFLRYFIFFPPTFRVLIGIKSLSELT